MASDDVTLGEVVRRLDDLQRTTQQIVERLDRDYVRHDRVAELERRVSSLESTLTWTVRLIMGAVILALVGLVLTQGRAV